MTRRTVLLAVGAVALVAVVVVGLIQAGGGGSGSDEAAVPTLAQARAELAGAPAPLAALHRQANELVGGGVAGAREQLAALKGHPVVINKWASWCGPCRLEFPVFQRVSAELGKDVAFLGLNSRDVARPAREFLREHPISYPSLEDPDIRIAQDLQGALAWPTTFFYDRQGEQCFVHQGQYTEDADLRRDIERYTRDGCV